MQVQDREENGKHLAGRCQGAAHMRMDDWLGVQIKREHFIENQVPEDRQVLLTSYFVHSLHCLSLKLPQLEKTEKKIRGAPLLNEHPQ